MRTLSFVLFGIVHLGVLASAAAQSQILDEELATVPSSWGVGQGFVSVAQYNDYVHDNVAHDGSFVEWDLAAYVESSSTYEISAKWNGSGSNRASSVEYQIDHSGGTTTVYMDQNIGMNAFNQLGTSFTNPTKVRVYTTASDTYVIADAIRLVKVEGSTLAPGPVNAGPALGTDSFVTLQTELGLYVPHIDNCDSGTESFVDIAETGRGYCIEKTARSAASWDDARNDCLKDAKRLPEAVEWKFACKSLNPADFTKSSSAPEWSSNFYAPFNAQSGSSTFDGVWVTTAGGPSDCIRLSYGAVSLNTGVEQSREYRCLR